MSAAAPTEPSRIRPPRTAMPEQPAGQRVGNFDEVALGYTPDMARAEAVRCLACKKPGCVAGCPVGIDIPGFITALAAGDVPRAYAVIRRANSLPAVCGRVCPQESQCERGCVLGLKGEPVAIGRLERYVADTFMADGACAVLTGAAACPPPVAKTRVACIGSGPASLTVAGTLVTRGIAVDVYEALHEPGGVLVYGIPEFRLPKAVVRREIAALKSLCVRFFTNWVGGRTVMVPELLDQGYEAVFIGIGAGLPVFLDIPGESRIGVFSANEYLTRVNLGRAYAFPEWDTPVYPGRRVVVFGAGNVALDAARTAVRLGARSVSIVYRRSENEMPARAEEIRHAREEGVGFVCLHAPVAFGGDAQGRLASVRLQRMRLGEPDASGRCRPVACEGAFCEIEADIAIVAVGTRANPLLPRSTPGLLVNRRGYISVTEATGETTLPMVFAGGDIVTGAATVISAMGAGRRAAEAISRRLLG